MEDVKITIEAARVNAHMTQEQAASALGVTRQTVSEWESRRRYPPIKRVMQMSELYKIPFEMLTFLP